MQRLIARLLPVLPRLQRGFGRPPLQLLHSSPAGPAWLPCRRRAWLNWLSSRTGPRCRRSWRVASPAAASRQGCWGSRVLAARGQCWMLLLLLGMGRAQVTAVRVCAAPCVAFSVSRANNHTAIVVACRCSTRHAPARSCWWWTSTTPVQSGRSSGVGARGGGMQSNPGYPAGAGMAGRGPPVLLPSQPPPIGTQPPIPCIAVFDLNSSAERPDELARPFMHEFFSAICEWAEGGSVGCGC